MESYTSDSSDNDNSNKVLEFSYLMLDTPTLYHYLEEFANNDKKPSQEIESLILKHNLLNHVPENIGKYNNLKCLDISSNNLSYLPDVLAYCPLTSLIAKNNNFTNESLPKTFTVTSTLRELNLSGNNLTNFPEQIIDFINLKYLYLSGNSICNIPKEIKKMKSLQFLSMGGNKLTEVPATVGELKYLQALVLSDNLLESLPANIANLHQLKSLLLHKNKIRTLPTDIVALKNLTELSLRDNPLVVRFVSDMTLQPASLLELAARVIKLYDIEVHEGDVPTNVYNYLSSAHHCVNPRCKGVYFDNRVEHIKFVDFCGKYRIPLLQYLCSTKCVTTPRTKEPDHSRFMMKKVLLG